MFYEQGQYSQAQINDLPMPWWADVLQDIPGIPTGIAINSNRTANTIIQGARGSGRRVGSIGGVFSQNLNPANLFRFSTDEFIKNPASVMKKGGAYTPYGAAAVGNAIARSRGKTEIFESGALGRITAAAKIENMSAAKFAKLSQTRAFQNTVLGAPKIGAGRGVQMTLPGMGGGSSAGLAPPTMPKGPVPAALTQREAGRGVLLQGGRVSGFVAEAGRYADELAGLSTRMPGAPTAAAQKGVAAAKRLQEISRAGGRGSRLASGALKGTNLLSKAAPALGPIGYVMLAYDVAKLTTKAVGYGARLAVDYNQSKYSGMRTEIGGARFVETEASLTSRSRGVAAIQNSRLNARSVLGAEAGSMATYFG